METLPPFDPNKFKAMVYKEGAEIRFIPRDINLFNNIQPENKTQPPVDKIEPILSSEQKKKKEESVCTYHYLHLYTK